MGMLGTRFNSCFSRTETICCVIASTFPKALCSVLYAWAYYAIAIDMAPTCFGGVVGWSVSLFTSAVAALGIYTYFLVIAIGPGSPLDFHDLYLDPAVDNVEESQPPEYLQSKTVTIKNNGDFRFCNKCKVWKPDRCHHCSSCRRCVLRMDHHCPWFATCIGFKNHRYFIQFLSYTACFGLIGTTAGFVVLYKFFTNEEYLDSYFSLTYLFVFVLGLTIFFSMAIFDGYSIYQVVHNVTTIESYDLQRYKSHSSSARDPNYKYSSRPSSDSVGNIFDLGWRDNWRSVMGNNWREWALPIPIRADHEDLSFKNGLNFEVNTLVHAKLVENARIQRELADQLAKYRSQKKAIQQQALDDEQAASGTRYGQFV